MSLNRMIVCALASALVLSSAFQAQAANSFRRDLEDPVCTPDGTTEDCVYTPSNKTAAELIYDMIRVVFDDMYPLDGYVRETRDGGQVAFSHPDASVMQALKDTAKQYDRYAEFKSPARIAVSVEIFAVDSSFLKKLHAELSFAEKTAIPTSADKATGQWSTDGKSFVMNGTFGNLPMSFIKAQLDFGKTQTERKLKDNASFTIPNGSSIIYSKGKTIYLPTNLQPIQEQAGLTLSGVANINGLNTDVVKIKNFSIRYGVPTTDGKSIVEAVNFTSDVDIKKGEAFIVTSNDLQIEETTRRNAYIFGGGRSKAKGQQTLLIAVTVTPLPPTGN